MAHHSPRRRQRPSLAGYANLARPTGTEHHDFGSAHGGQDVAAAPRPPTSKPHFAIDRGTAQRLPDRAVRQPKSRGGRIGGARGISEAGYEIVHTLSRQKCEFRYPESGRGGPRHLWTPAVPLIISSRTHESEGTQPEP
jgi:hypothetical protein